MGIAIALPIVAAGTAIIDVAAVVVGAAGIAGTAIYIAEHMKDKRRSTAEHTKNKRPSTEDKHEKGEARRRKEGGTKREQKDVIQRGAVNVVDFMIVSVITYTITFTTKKITIGIQACEGRLPFLCFSDMEAPGTEAVYGFWNDLKEHTYHMGTWSNETKGLIHWFAFPPGQQGANSFPVHSFWDDANRSHSFHMGDPWYPGETKGDIHFYAYNYQHPGTFPVHSYWDDEHRDHAYAMVLA